jgi:RND family efflux transporter MFP subunit
MFVFLLLFFVACSRGPAASDKAGDVVAVRSVSLPEEVLASGTVKPMVDAEVKVGSRLSGVLRRLYVKVGAIVRAGQVLAELDRQSLITSVDQRRAALNEAEARLALAQKLHQRRKMLAGEGLVTAEDLDQAASSEALDLAQLNGAKAELRAAEIELTYATIRAPIAGCVTEISTREGETVAASFAVPTFLRIVDLKRLQLEAYVDEVDIGRVTQGQEATFTVDAFPEETFRARVEAVTPQAITRGNIVNYVVVIGIASPNAQVLRPEMSASVTIATGTRRTALIVPTGALRWDPQGRASVLVRQGGKDVTREVSVGGTDGGQVRIKAGLAAGEQVVVSSEPHQRVENRP